MPDIRARTDFMKKLHLFRTLNDEQLKFTAEKMTEQSYVEADTVFTQGAPSDALYVIYQGKVEIYRQINNKKTRVATLVRGDYFGEQGLFTGEPRNATVKADKGTLLLVISREAFRRMLRKIPDLRDYFELIVSSRKLAAKMHFKWLLENEVIYFLSHKHKILLLQSFIIPIIVMVVVLLMAISSIFLPGLGTTLVALAGVLFLVDGAWMLWKYVDWSNDFYIVTNLRVIWLEKVVGLYDSRNEASHNTILSVSTESDQQGRLLDYGVVIVRTFTGQIRMDYVETPKLVGALIEEYWQRTKDSMRSGEQDGLKQAIRAKLGYPAPGKPAPPPAPPVKVKKTPATDFQKWWGEIFRTRMESGTNIMFRKHVFMLFKTTLIQTIVFILLIVAPLVWYILFGTPPLWILGIFAIAILIDALWWFYEYLDWSNDVYQVTAEQIIHIERKPFGEETRKSSPLENILNTEYKREGILPTIFNFGTVYVTVGGTQFNFEDVADPPAVQQEIVRRQQARTQKKKESEGAAERDRMIDWLAMYHRTIEEIEREQNQAKPKTG